MAGEKSLSINARKFCKYCVECHGNATDAYIKAYGISNRDSARKGGSRLLKSPKIQKLIEDLMEELGFNNVAVDLELMKLIKQDENKSLKLHAIKEYTKLKRRGVYDKSKLNTSLLTIDMDLEETSDELLSYLMHN